MGESSRGDVPLGAVLGVVQWAILAGAILAFNTIVSQSGMCRFAHGGAAEPNVVAILSTATIVTNGSQINSPYFLVLTEIKPMLRLAILCWKHIRRPQYRSRRGCSIAAAVRGRSTMNTIDASVPPLGDSETVNDESTRHSREEQYGHCLLDLSAWPC
ncbi:hypothetical protein NA57DRAFT_73576 [Rhizodiscina lignyota]|uniref:Uncharacterized protein n=1 Tax=Rhizodiscina lignyota TaxID=1504668 RepID=A0A9P4II88_9PEZI|nr:hypothetical protein NA57DRAFT_73576 [Rhizodiscina lignyota]